MLNLFLPPPFPASPLPASPLHCLHYADELRLEAGGVVRSILDLTAMLARCGVRVTILTGDASGAPDPWKSPKLPSENKPVSDNLPRVIEINRALFPWKRSAADRSEINKAIASADVVHLHTVWDPFNLTIAAAARRAGVPWVLTAHGMLDDQCMESQSLKKQIYLPLVGRRLIESASRVHFTATGERDQSLKRAPAMRPVVLPLVIDLPPLETLPSTTLARTEFPIPFASGEPVLLFLGRVHPIKGIDLLIEALGQVIRRGTPAQLIVAGPAEPGYREELERVAKKNKITSQVHFVGMLHGDIKLSLYRACDLYVLPSLHENFGIALVEAMACGAAAVTTRSVNIWPEVERYGATVVGNVSENSAGDENSVGPENSVESLASGLQQCLNNLDSVRERALAGREGLREWLEPKRIGEQYTQMYRDVVAENGAEKDAAR